MKVGCEFSLKAFLAHLFANSATRIQELIKGVFSVSKSEVDRGKCQGYPHEGWEHPKGESDLSKSR